MKPNLNKKIQDFGTPKAALEIFNKFAGKEHLINPSAREEALTKIGNSLQAYGKNIFAIRVEMPSGEIVWQNGMYNALARTDIKRFDQFQTCVHPDYLEGYNFWASCLFEGIAANNFDFNGFVYHIRIPLKNDETNTYYWYNQHSIALITDTEGSVLSFLNVYTYDSEYHEGNPIIMLPSISYNNKKSHLDTMLKNIGGAKILAGFTPMEQNILRCYVEGIKPNERFQTMSKHTIYDHNVNILAKAKKIFRFGFVNAEKVAEYMNFNGMIANTP